MLKKDLRIRRQRDFDRIFKEGVFFSSGYLALKLAKNDLFYSRFGFVVSNKISKQAVKRNRMKRLLRESIRASYKNIAPGFDVVMMARVDFSEKKMAETKDTVDNLLKKSGLCA